MSALAAWDWPDDKPLSKPRRQLTVAASKLAGAVLWSLGFSIRVRGREHLRKALRATQDRPILIFNHVRRDRVVFFSLRFGGASFVTSAEGSGTGLNLFFLSLFLSLSLSSPPIRSPGQMPL